MIERKALIDIYGTIRDFVWIEPRRITSSDLGVNESKLGGTPYLPPSLRYPKTSSGVPMHLLAQINFVDVPRLKPFPEDGILQFYIDPSNDLYGRGENGQGDGFKVVYVPYVADYSDHTSAPSLPTLEPGDFPIDGVHRLSFCRTSGPVPVGHPLFNALFSTYLEDDLAYYEAHRKNREPDFYDLYEGLIKDMPNSAMGGYPVFVQGLPEFLPDDFDEHYILLLQIGSSAHICFGDAGSAYFFIKKADLEKLDFSRVLYHWDSC